MLRNIINTFTVKVGSNVISLLIVVLTANFLGTEGRGEIGIFTVSMTFIIMLNGFVGSSSIVYLTPRSNFYKLIIPSYIWILISSVAGSYGIFQLFSYVHEYHAFDGQGFEPVKPKYIVDLMILAAMGSAFEVNQMVLLGKQKIKSRNYLGLFRLFTMISLLLFHFLITEEQSFESFLHSLHISYALGLFGSFVLLYKEPEKIELRGLGLATKAIVKYSFIDQLSNVLQFLNKRAFYFFILLYSSLHDAGVFNIAIVLTESVWMVSQSISMIQYSKLSNSRDQDYNIGVSVHMFKISLLLLTIGIGVLCLMPGSFYTFALNEGFDGAQPLVLILAVGTIFMGSGHIFNHYFSGIGKFEQNIYSNLLGLAATSYGCLYLIPEYGLIGAAWTITMSYSAIGLYLLIAFKVKTRIHVKALLFNKSDIKLYLSKFFPTN